MTLIRSMRRSSVEISREYVEKEVWKLVTHMLFSGHGGERQTMHDLPNFLV